MSRNSHTIYAWIVDQLIGIRNLEQELSEALADRKGRCGVDLHTKIAELNLWVDVLDRVLNNSITAANSPRTVRHLRPRHRGNRVAA